MIFVEQFGDLFDDEVLKNYALCHCISSDFALGAGIAKIFAQMGVKNQLCEQFPKKWQNRGYCLIIKVDNIVVGNLVTKERYFHKPTIESVEQALDDFREQMIKLGLNKIAMPKIGCGLDKLKWEDVKEVIQKVFAETDFEILVRYI